MGGWTKPAPRLYPHQWNWDAAFIAIGLARSDPDRALRELEHLLSAQWRDWLLWWGMTQRGSERSAARLRAPNLALLSRAEAHFAEYFEPFRAAPLGSLDQSWTAAVALDWLASEAISD